MSSKQILQWVRVDFISLFTFPMVSLSCESGSSLDVNDGKSFILVLREEVLSFGVLFGLLIDFSLEELS